MNPLFGFDNHGRVCLVMGQVDENDRVDSFVPYVQDGCVDIECMSIITRSITPSKTGIFSKGFIKKLYIPLENTGFYFFQVTIKTEPTQVMQSGKGFRLFLEN